MLRMMASIVLELAANAIGLIVADWLLPGFSIDLTGFLVAVGLFTVAKFILGPLLMKMSFQYVHALSGGVALVTTLVGLIVTTLLTDGLVITGIGTWAGATLIVWLFGVIASIVLPLFLFRELLSNAKDRRSIPPAA